MSRATFAILSTENLLHNLSVIKQYASRSKIIAMVKANAYGHGLRSVSLRLQDHVYSLGVASIDEAIALRKAGVTIPITLMQGVFEPDELLVAACERFHVVIHDHVQIQWLKTVRLPLPLTVWLKVDTGLGRLGFLPHEAMSVYEFLSSHAGIAQPVGIMSHFACAEDLLHPLNQEQIHTFRSFVDACPGPKSFCNSAATFLFPDQQYDFVRPGIALYGISPFQSKTGIQLGLKPVMTLQTRLIAVKMVRKGSSIGYGARYICPETMPIGVISIGYGDGWPRTARDGTPVLVNGTECQLVGRVSMDLTTIDLRSCPSARVNDPVLLWGDGLPIERIASFTSHVPYDLVTAMQSRVRFHWTMRY